MWQDWPGVWIWTIIMTVFKCQGRKHIIQQGIPIGQYSHDLSRVCGSEELWWIFIWIFIISNCIGSASVSWVPTTDTVTAVASPEYTALFLLKTFFNINRNWRVLFLINASWIIILLQRPFPVAPYGENTYW